MGLDFRIRDFAYPLALFGLKREFDANQWKSEAFLKSYQAQKLRRVLSHSLENVPYYRDLFRRVGISGVTDADESLLSRIPGLTKEMLRDNFTRLTSDRVERFVPLLTSTSGSTGGAIDFYVDKTSNVLEFVFYWRAWGWAGYRLGDSFAELSAQHFTPYEERGHLICDREILTRRVLVNSLLISRKNLDRYIEMFRKFKPKFLKGLPTNLYMLALVFSTSRTHGISFRAVFSQGENLLEHQRRLIEEVFSTTVYDFYGHMERTVAITQCEFGSYHVHMDYGIAEFLPPERDLEYPCGDDEAIAEISGTSLHNFAMPLIRYRTGDLVRLYKEPKSCACGRTFPLVKGIIGRDCDTIVTPDGRAVTALYVALDRTAGLALGKVVQEKRDSIVVRVAPAEGGAYSDEELRANLVEFLGDSMKIQIVHEQLEKIRGTNGRKFKVIDSSVPPEQILE